MYLQRQASFSASQLFKSAIVGCRHRKVPTTIYRLEIVRSFSGSEASHSSPTETTTTNTTATAIPPNGYVFDRIAVVGAGKMALALLEPMIAKGVQPANRFCVYDVSNKAMEAMGKQLGVQTSDSISQVVNDADLIILAVKPQNITDAFFAEVQKGTPNPDAIVLSIIAGKTMSEFVNTGLHRIVRSMPNTPAMIGQGMTVWSCTPDLNKTERQKIRDVLNSCGKSVRMTTTNVLFCVKYTYLYVYVDNFCFRNACLISFFSSPTFLFLLLFL